MHSTKCQKTKAAYPSFSPIIYNLSVTKSVFSIYSNVIITGSNFFPPINGTTYVNFGEFKNLQPVFYSSGSMSFVVPLNAPRGKYDVIVVNVYNGNFSNPISNSYSGNLNYSNSYTYTIV